jgi:hypothetical protein
VADDGVIHAQIVAGGGVIHNDDNGVIHTE